jgi:group I intron endonuclease
MSQNYCIYQLTSPDGKSYIGRTNNLTPRLISHKNGRTVISKALRLIGIDNFKVEVLCNGLTRQEANILEVEYIAKLNTLYPNGYNCNTGGEVGYKVCDAIREATVIAIAKAKA